MYSPRSKIMYAGAFDGFVHDNRLALFSVLRTVILICLESIIQIWEANATISIWAHNSEGKEIDEYKKDALELHVQTTKKWNIWALQVLRTERTAHAGFGTGTGAASVTYRSSSSELDSPRKCERIVLAEACTWLSFKIIAN